MTENRQNHAKDQRSSNGMWTPGMCPARKGTPPSPDGTGHRPYPHVLAVVALTLVGLVVRMVRLGEIPLSDAEATQALMAWGQYQAGHLHATWDYSPLLLTLNMVTFWLVGASQFAARLAPAILGTMMIPLPFGLRRHLGTSGAVASSALIAFSPLFLRFSRSLNAEVATAFAGLAILVGILNVTGESDGRGRLAWFWRGLVLAGSAVMLTSSPSAYSMLLAGIVGLLVVLLRTDSKPFGLGFERLRTAGFDARILDWVLVFVCAIVALATACFFNYGGLAECSHLVTRWVNGFADSAAPGPERQWLAGPIYPGVVSVALYEPLALLAGLVGAVVAFAKRRPFDLFLIPALVVAVVLDLVRAGRSDGEVLVLLLPLVLLAGMALGRLWDSLWREAQWSKEGVVTAAGLVVATYAYVQLMVYAKSGGGSWFLPVGAVILFVALVAVVWLLNDSRTAVRAAAATAVICLILFEIGAVTRLNAGPVLNPRQVATTSPADAGLFALETTLEYVSSARAKDPFLVGVVATRDSGPAVEWVLRRFPNVTWLDSVVQLAPDYALDDKVRAIVSSTETFVTPGTPQTGDTPYAGQGFSVRARWSPSGLTGGELITWLLLHAAQTPATRDEVVLWVRQ